MTATIVRTRSNRDDSPESGKRVVVIKKIFAVLLSAVMICAFFTACSGHTEEVDPTATVAQIPTEEAKIKDSDAISFIENSYTPKELGLDKTDKDYTFMIASNGVDIDGEKYVKVVANVIVKKDVTTEDGKETFSMETIGEYYISFDGTKVLKKDMKNNKLSKLENRYDAYSAKGDTTAQTQAEE